MTPGDTTLKARISFPNEALSFQAATSIAAVENDTSSPLPGVSILLQLLGQIAAK